MCTSLLLERSRKRSSRTKKKTILPEKEGILSLDKYKPGDLVYIDQFVVNTPVKLTTGYGQESFYSQFIGVALYNDAATGIIWVENQVSLGASETVLGRKGFEQ